MWRGGAEFNFVLYCNSLLGLEGGVDLWNHELIFQIEGSFVEVGGCAEIERSRWTYFPAFQVKAKSSLFGLQPIIIVMICIRSR
jgi:hypothetical protein